ncbi:WD40 repeat domain-containing protein [Bacillus sp. FJAT-47783]|uniref:WD40 repeat domain-containing protein n=1 Tax=Bacillus sp. FJAT-47783 TaxID=2922712 RepID=UPI001FACEB08|nr:WD40 repeat domain-containing protein [Bacillus sp. FJAT-47783]
MKKTIKVWDAFSGRLIKEKKAHDGSIKRMDVSFSRNLIATGSYDRSISIWDLDTLELVNVFKGFHKWENGISFSPEGDKIISGSFDGHFRIFDVISKTEIVTPEAKTHGINNIDVLYSGKIATGSDDNLVRIWDMKTGEQIEEYQGHDSLVQSVKWAPNGEYLASTSYDETIILWDVKNKKAKNKYLGHEGIVNTVSWCFDSSKFATGGYDKKLRIWGLEDGLLFESQPHAGAIKAVDWHKSTNLIAVGSNDGMVHVWNPETNLLIKSIKAHDQLINQISWSPDGKFIVSVSRDKSVRISDIEKESCSVLVSDAHRKSIKSVAWSTDGSMIATGSYDNESKIWSVKTGELITTIKEHHGGVSSLSFIPGCQKFVTASWDGTARIWELEGDLISILDNNKEKVSL